MHSEECRECENSIRIDINEWILTRTTLWFRKFRIYFRILFDVFNDFAQFSSYFDDLPCVLDLDILLQVLYSVSNFQALYASHFSSKTYLTAGNYLHNWLEISGFAVELAILECTFQLHILTVFVIFNEIHWFCYYTTAFSLLANQLLKFDWLQNDLLVYLIQFIESTAPFRHLTSKD